MQEEPPRIELFTPIESFVKKLWKIYFCPFKGTIMYEPTIYNGTFYEREAVLGWFVEGDIPNPVKGTVVTIQQDLGIQPMLRDTIEKLLKENPWLYHTEHMYLPRYLIKKFEEMLTEEILTKKDCSEINDLIKSHPGLLSHKYGNGNIFHLVCSLSNAIVFKKIKKLIDDEFEKLDESIANSKLGDDLKEAIAGLLKSPSQMLQERNSFALLPVQLASRRNDADVFLACMKILSPKDYYNITPIARGQNQSPALKDTLTNSVVNDNKKLAEFCVSCGVEIDDILSNRLLITCAQYSRFEIIKYFLDDLKLDVNINVLNNTPLHAATQYKCREMIKILLKRGADYTIYTFMMTPLHICIKENFQDILNIFLNYDDKALEFIDDHEKTLLHLAVESKNLSMVEFLCGKKFANIDKRCHDTKETALFMAVYLNQPDIVDVLISRGADVNLEDKDGLTPLHLAVKDSRSKIILKLFESGRIIPNRQTKNGDTVFHYAVQKIKSNEEDNVTGLLLDNKFNAFIKNKNKLTALDIANKKGLNHVAYSIMDGTPSIIIKMSFFHGLNKAKDKSKKRKKEILFLKRQIAQLEEEVNLTQTLNERNEICNEFIKACTINDVEKVKELLTNIHVLRPDSRGIRPLNFVIWMLNPSILNMIFNYTKVNLARIAENIIEQNVEKFGSQFIWEKACPTNNYGDMADWFYNACKDYSYDATTIHHLFKINIICIYCDGDPKVIRVHDMDGQPFEDKKRRDKPSNKVKKIIENMNESFSKKREAVLMSIALCSQTNEIEEEDNTVITIFPGL